jgi:hypothetical protein
VIQSDGAGIVGQSSTEDVDELDEPFGESAAFESDFESDVDSDFDSEPDSAFAAAFVFVVEPRSLRAQPLPLKTIEGGLRTLRIEPSVPHEGQNFGPGSLMPWRMSVRWPQDVQRYS